QEIQIANEAGDTVRKKLETGPFEIEVPVKAGRSKISIDFSQAANLPKGDGRNVAALLQSIAMTPAPEGVDRMSRSFVRWPSGCVRRSSDALSGSDQDTRQLRP